MKFIKMQYMYISNIRLNVTKLPGLQQLDDIFTPPLFSIDIDLEIIIIICKYFFNLEPVNMSLICRSPF